MSNQRRDSWIARDISKILDVVQLVIVSVLAPALTNRSGNSTEDSSFLPSSKTKPSFKKHLVQYLSCKKNLVEVLRFACLKKRQ